MSIATMSRTARTMLAGALLCASSLASADEGGVSFWLPGQFGSLAAVPGSPGWSLPMIYYHLDADEGASKEFPVGGNITAGIDVGADMVFLVPTYTLARPVWGGQLGLSMAWAYADMDVSARAILTGPFGNSIEVDPHDSATAGSDLYPMATLKWNKGTSNYLVYVMGGIPVGKYDVGDLANIGTNHYSFDAGLGYTFFDPQHSHWEYSSTIGVTYNFENEDTDYRNGVDSHLDVGVSCWFSPTFFIGGVGYAYYQLGGDSGAGATLGDFKSRVFSVGPQAGWFLGPRRVYLNLKGYYEFDARHRPEGWNAWLTLMVPLGPQKKER